MPRSGETVINPMDDWGENLEPHDEVQVTTTHEDASCVTGSASVFRLIADTLFPAGSIRDYHLQAHNVAHDLRHQSRHRSDRVMCFVALSHTGAQLVLDTFASPRGVDERRVS